MKILYYSPHPYLHLESPSGYGRHMREMIQAFSENNEVRHCIIGDALNPQVQKLNPETTNPSSRAKSLAKKMLRGRLRESAKDIMLIRDDRRAQMILNAACDSFKPDLIYERGHFLMHSGTQVAKERGVRHVWELNSPFLEEKVLFSGRSFTHRLVEQIEKQNFINTSLAVFVTENLRNHYIKKHPFITSKSIVTQNAIRPGQEAYDDNLLQRLTKTYKGNAQKLIGFVGSILPHHGVDLLIEGFAEVAENLPYANLMIVGNGETLPKIKNLAADKGLSHRIIFTGNVPASEVFTYLKLFDIGILASTSWYASPVKLFEYGLAKLPVIAPDSVTVREILQNGNEALLVRKDPKIIGRAIQTLFEKPEYARQIAENFHHKVLSHYTWQHNADRVLSFFSGKTGA